jgi:hypothetical protein
MVGGRATLTPGGVGRKRGRAVASSGEQHRASATMEDGVVVLLDLLDHLGGIDGNLLRWVVDEEKRFAAGAGEKFFS